MSPKTKKKTTKKRTVAKNTKSVKKKEQKSAFWGYLKIIIVCLIVGALTYAALSYIYSNKDSQNTIKKIEKYLDKQSVKKDPPAKEPAVKFEPKTESKIEPKISVEPKIKPKTQNEVKPQIKSEAVKQEDTLNKTDNSTPEPKITPKEQQEFYPPEIPDEKPTKKGSIHIEVFDKDGAKQDERRVGEVPKKQPPQRKTKESESSLDTSKAQVLNGTKKQFGKPKLVIIIDDVAHKHQVDAIKSIKLKLTPSFFPATKDHPDTPKLAKKFSFYMIHLPLQAKNFKGEEIDTLRVDDGYEKILNRLQAIKRDFPNLIYINNHTGSKFTSDFDAMDRLMRAVKHENLIFIDSKTIANTKVAAAAKKHSMPYISRDVFLDHEDSKAAITKQLKYAVALAKKHSRAIAIGHPYKNTMDVLKNSSEILKDVEVVYLKDIL
ncbi:divergent polysaccharide deacetylase family protein [Campylobacter sp. RM15925]|uniref:divergent polysaccharide deacetylase family protein n=1 Tax=Campylobacter sp. RM15925 TaxID=1705724 RepID=UPI001473FB7B|nr:divergent polysaccharide deacetylase family protein [Campylobacter sp. RM15925]